MSQFVNEQIKWLHNLKFIRIITLNFKLITYICIARFSVAAILASLKASV